MARLRGPENGSRLALRLGGTPATLTPAVLYAGPTGDVRADVLFEDGTPVVGGEVVTDGYGFLPQIQFPDGATVIYAEVGGGSRQAIYALPNYGQADALRDVLPVGHYVMSSPSNNGAYNANLNREFCIPLLIFDTGRLDRLGCELSGLGSAGAVFRLGIRANDGGKPSRTVLAEGVVDATAGEWKEIAIDVPIKPGLLWLSIVGQGWTTTAPQFHTANWGPTPFGNIAGALTTMGWARGHGPQTLMQDSVVGTLADHLTVPQGSGVNLPIPLFVVRRSV